MNYSCHDKPAPEIIQEALVTFTQVATPFAVKVLVPVVAELANVIVSVVTAMLTLFAEPLTIVIAVPVVNATFEFAGIV